MGIQLGSTKTSKSSSRELGPGMQFFFSRIFPLIFIIAGGTVGYFGFKNLINAEKSSQWPSVGGRVVSSAVETHHSSGKNSSTTYHAAITYEFRVKGDSFTGDRVAYGDYGSSNSSHARGIVNRYPVNTKVKVYYMPGNPSECLLEPGLHAQAFFMPAFGLIFFGAGILMAFFLPRAMKKEAEKSAHRKTTEAEMISTRHETDSSGNKPAETVELDEYGNVVNSGD